MQHASEQATQSAAHATSATQKQTVQVDAKSAVLHAADARLALAQLHQLEPQRSAKSSKHNEADLKKAETDYQKASHELTSLLKTTVPSFKVSTDAHDNATASDEISETESEGADEGIDTWKEVSDEEAIRRAEVDRMSNKDSRVT